MVVYSSICSASQQDDMYDAIEHFSICARLTGASVHGRRCPSDVIAAEQGFKDLTQLYPDYADVWLGYASMSGQEVMEQIYMHRHNLGQLQRACELQPPLCISYYSGLYLNFTATTLAEISLAYAAWLISQQRWAHAYDIITALTEEHAQWLELLWVHTVLYYQTGRWNDVISLLSPHASKFETFDPFFSQAFTVAFGISLAKLNMGAAALKYLEQAKGPIEDAYFDGIYAQALVLRVLERSEESDALLHELHIRFPHDQQVWKAISDTTIGISVTSMEKIRARTDPWDITTEPDERTLEHNAKQETRAQLLAEAETDLSQFVGIAEVKEQVQKLKSSVVMSIMRKKRGLEVAHKSHHLIFAGPPGTGKTTIARVIAKIYCGLGIISKNTVTEVVRSDLIGQHIGETEAKTNAIIDRALHGVLFIDEAYSLVSTGSKNDFGLVAIDTLLARMENERDKLIVIAAGYPDDLQLFLNTNEGLRSRFSRTIEFASYNPEELLEMARLLGHKRDSLFNASAQKYMLDIFNQLCTHAIDDDQEKTRRAIDIAGNGRFVRNLVENAEENREHRLNQLSDHTAITNEQLMTIDYADVHLASMALMKNIGLSYDD